MIQTVGIKFEAQGLTQVTTEMRTLAAGVKSLVTGIKNLETLDTAKAITNLNRLALGMGNAASKLSMAANEINAAVTAFTGANAVLGRGRPGGITTGTDAVHSAKEKTPWYTPSAILGTAGNLAKYSVGFGLVYGAKEAATLGTGTGREDMKDALLNLHAIGYKSKEDKAGVERAATAFAKRIRGDVGISELMNVYAEMGSAIPHDDPTAPALTKKTHAILMEQATAFGRLSQMTPVAAAGLLESMLSGYYYMGKPETKQKMRNQPGYIEEMSGNMAGQMYRAIDIFKLKGQDIAEFMKYMTPSMIERGWDFPTMVALSGMGSSMGFRTNQQGRGTKTLLEARPEQLGEIMLAGSADKKVSDWYKGLKAKEQKVAGWEEFKKYESEFKGDLVEFLRTRLSPAAQRAQGYGYNLAEFTGSDFLPLAKAMLNPEFLNSLSHALDIVRKTQMGTHGLQKEYEDVTKQDSAWAPAELKNAWDALTKAVGDAAGPVAMLTQGITGMGAGILNFLAKWQEWTNNFNREKGVSGWVKEKVEGAGGFVKDWAKAGVPLVDFMKQRDNQPMGNQMVGMGSYNKALANLRGDTFAEPADAGMWKGGNMKTFNVPNIAPTVPQMTQSVNVYGTGEVTVWIKQDGKPDEKKTAPLTFRGNKEGVSNSTGRFYEGQPDLQGGQ